MGGGDWVGIKIGVATHQATIQRPKRLYKDSESYAKPRNTIQSPDKPYRAPTDYTKPPLQKTVYIYIYIYKKYVQSYKNIIQKPTNVKQRHKVLNKSGNKY